jgi:6-phosphofructokinase 1
MIVIPEMFNKTKIGFDPIVKIIISAMIKRKIMGIDYGCAMISEGVFHFITEDEIKNSGINFTFDEHGHPELGNVSKAHIFNILVQEQLKKEGIKIKSRPVELGYEFRCARPIAYDLKYATLLGTGVQKLYEENHTGCMVTVDHLGTVSPLYLKDVADENGKIKPRLVNIDSEQVQTVLTKNVQYLTSDDFDGAGKYLKNPEEYDYMNIMNW